MPKNGYLPSPDVDRAAWLKNFSGKLPLYGISVGLTAAEIAATAADSTMFSYTLDQVEWFKKEASKRVAFKNLLADAEIGTLLGEFPVTADIPDVPAAVPAGIFKRNAKLVQRIKNHPNYTLAIGEDLSIESHDLMTAMVSVKPELKVTLDAGKPVLKWKKGNMPATDLFVDRGDEKGFQFLATATVPYFIDDAAIPAGTNAAQWSYKAIFKIGNDETGEFSDPVSIAVSRQL